MARLSIYKRGAGALAVALFVMISSPANAGLWKDIWKGSKISAGLGLGMVPDYEGSDDYKGAGLPIFNATWKKGQYLRLGGHNRSASLRWNMMPSKVWSVGPVFQFRQGAWKDTNDSKVRRMRGDGNAYESGIFVGRKFGNFSMQVQAVIDKKGHDGGLFDIKAGYRHPFSSQTGLSVTATTTYASDDYMHSYFSINGRNSTASGLKRYKATEDFKDVGISLALDHKFADSNWSMLGLVSATRMLNDAADSPVTDDRGDENQFVGAIAAIYSFD